MWAQHVELVKSKGVPLYQQLAEHFEALIVSAVLKVGEQLPTEAELCRQFGISRITVRQALGILTSQGLIERFASRGTFVKQANALGGWEIRTIEDLVQQGIQIKTEIISWRLIEPPEAVRSYFNNADFVYRLRAVRSHDAVPIYFVENYLSKKVGDQLSKQDLTTRTVVDLLKNKLNIPLMIASEEIAADIADKNLAEHLWIKPGKPILIQRIELRDEEGEVLQIGTGWWHGERFKRRYTFN